MKAIEALNKMKDVLIEDGWCKFLLEDEHGRVCLVGARNKVFGYSMENERGSQNYEVDYVSELIESILPDVHHRRHPVDEETRMWRYNDACESLNEVLDIIDQAIYKEKEMSSSGTFDQS